MYDTFCKISQVNIDEKIIIIKKGMIRNSRTPTLMIVGLVIVIIIITYNYWNLLDRNTALRDKLMISEEKIIDLNEKKASLEKQSSTVLEQVKSLEEKSEKKDQALLKKGSEIDELNSKLQSKIQENDKLIADTGDAKEKLVNFYFMFKLALNSA